MEKLGIQPIQLLTQIFNFLVMVILLTKFLYKPIIKMLDERKKKIQDGLEYTEKTRQELEKIEKKKAEITRIAENQAKKIIEEGKLTGKKLEEEIVKKAHKEALDIVEKGKKEVELEKMEMEKQLKTKTVEIAAALAEKVLLQILNKDDQKNIIDKKLKEISKFS